MLDRLFLLGPEFMERDRGPYFCPESALVEGMLSFYPALRTKLDVEYVDFAKPRAPIVALLGEGVQRCPVLVLGDAGAPVPEGVRVGEANGRRYIVDERQICRYLASTFSVGEPHP